MCFLVSNGDLHLKVRIARPIFPPSFWRAFVAPARDCRLVLRLLRFHYGPTNHVIKFQPAAVAPWIPAVDDRRNCALRVHVKPLGHIAERLEALTDWAQFHSNAFYRWECGLETACGSTERVDPLSLNIGQLQVAFCHSANLRLRLYGSRNKS